MTLPAETFPKVMRALDLISQGRSPTAACDIAQISYSQFLRYVKDTPELHDMFADAKQRGYDTLADLLLEIDSNPMGSSDPKVMKVLSDNIKWYLSKKRPDQYGEKVVHQHDHVIRADRVITEALERGKQRALGNVIEDVTYKVVEERPVNLTGLDDDLLQFV